jgi:trehalose-phosphatase
MEKGSLVRRSTSDRIFREMQEIRRRLDEIEKTISSWKPQPLDVHESELLSLPDHLRKTYLTVVSQGQCNATQVSNSTGRSRAIESSHLNQLAQTGWLTRRRDSKEIFFFPVTRRALGEKDRQEEIRAPQPARPSEKPPNRKSGKGRVVPKTMSVRCLSTDYDGTISPIHVARCESHVPLETRVMLNQIGRSLPITIITMKDLHFVTSRTPFAQAWSAIGGLETQIGKRIFKKESIESKLETISQAMEYAKPHANAAGIEFEEKQDSEGRTIAFCVDWRRAKNPDTAKQAADRIIEFSEALGLRVLKYENQPFYDVYPIVPDKGKALQEMLSELAVKNGAMYLGDSETDNTAFKNSSISIGVIHDESALKNLECDYLVKFEDLPDFFKTLIAKNFQFSSDFPMIKANPNTSKQDLNASENGEQPIG